LPASFSWLIQSVSFRFNFDVPKYWETIVEKLKCEGWSVRWIEATQDGESGWTATAIREKERHSTHANDITLAFQELEASCRSISSSPPKVEFRRKTTAIRRRLKGL
jgi:hypothetical protein